MLTVKIKKSFIKKGEREFTLDADFSAGRRHYGFVGRVGRGENYEFENYCRNSRAGRRNYQT